MESSYNKMKRKNTKRRKERIPVCGVSPPNKSVAQRGTPDLLEGFSPLTFILSLSFDFYIFPGRIHPPPKIKKKFIFQYLAGFSRYISPPLHLKVFNIVLYDYHRISNCTLTQYQQNEIIKILILFSHQQLR